MSKKLISKNTLSVAILTVMGLPFESWATSEKPAGKVVIIKGQAEKTSAQGLKTKLKEGMSVSTGDAISTSDNSAVKVVLSDMTEMSIGPSSKFVIDDFQQEKPSIFSMAFGTLRAKVSKSLNGDVKAIIKTKSSTMGVRGTDFQTVYNEQTQMTSLVTFEGAVAMVKNTVDNSSASAESLVSRLTNPDQAVTVTQGQFSGVTTAQENPTLPVKISPAQLESLKTNNPTETKSNTTVVVSASNTTANGVKIISPIPPGVDAKLITGSLADLKNAMSATVKTEPTNALSPTGPPPEGSFNASTGQIAPPAGGFIDMSTGLYVPPPPGSTFDPIAGVYVPPPSMGSFNVETGKYLPPQGFTLDATKGFVAIANTPNEQRAQNHSPGGSRSEPIRNEASPSVRQPLSGGLFPGMDVKQFGTGMIAAPPPPGMTPSQMPTGPGMIPPSAGNFVYNPGAEGLTPIGFTPPPGGFVPNFDGMQPQYPVYNPFVCPPYCDPQSQPGAYPEGPPPGTGGTGVSFDIS